MSMPNSLFWAGTFMIEYLALFFTLLSLYSYILFTQDQNFKHWVLLTSFVSLACLQKITTILPVGLVLVAVYFTITLNKYKKASTFNKNEFLGLLSSAVISLSIYFAWMKYTDKLKSIGEFTKYLTSDQLTDWNFGTVSMLLTQDFWTSFLLKSTLFNSGIVGAIFIALSGFIILKGNDKRLFCTLLLLYCLPFVIFKPLHITHDYYQNANLIYLAFALGIAADAMYAVRRKLTIMLTCAVLLVNYVLFLAFFGSQKLKPLLIQDSPKLQLARVINQNIPVSDVFILAGYDWTSEIAYYAERYAIMVPDWVELHEEGATGAFEKILNNPRDFSEKKIGMIILCNQYNNSDLVAFIQKHAKAKRFSTIDNCSIMNT